MTNNDYLDQFIEYISFERMYSSHTIRSYKNDLEEYLAFLQSYDTSVKVTKTEKSSIQFFLQKLSEKGLTARTVARKLATLKSFYKYLFLNQVTQKNIAATVKTPKLPKHLPDFLKTSEAKSLMELPDLSTIEGKRDRLILELFYSTGVRISELINIKLKDIQVENRIIRILGKGNKERLVIFSSYVAEAYKQYMIEIVKHNDIQSQEYLFPSIRKSKSNNSSNHICQKTVYNIVKKYLRQISNNEKLSPHSIRHTFATHLLNNGADLVAVKELLGHSSLSSTQIYTHVQIEKLKNEYNKSHPHAKK
ncbi:MAG: tyrosine recombinase [Candidatus Marinimicrobia bacterium]|nr:tyrosine recombinase [Candidatus Neomarinimicrobiota bacterium]